MSKKVLVPAKKDINPFFESISKYSSWKFDYGSLESSTEGYSAILIHWPEQLFNWNEPTDLQLTFLNEKIKEWRVHLKIVYVVHNEKRHYGSTKNFKKLYDLILRSSDVMVHLGMHSLKNYQLKYPDTSHICISHPLYEQPFILYDKVAARNQLNIPLDSKVIISPGTIRNHEERKLIIKAFKKLKLKNKFLLVPRMYYKKIDIDFPGRYALKSIVDIKKVVEQIYNKPFHSAMRYNFGFQDFENLSLMMSASDVVLIPRINTLNSGNVFLGLSYKKIVVGPKIGNIKEVLEDFGLPVFDLENTESIVQALYDGLQLQQNGYVYNQDLLSKYNPNLVAKGWDSFLDTLVDV